ncbi:MAG TPA: DUF3616 domain-containing protein [Verrucomicrobiota bacterium]|nr:DUF3616 domain-containing protein [Verrucomicrobiota bacterium]HNU52661.1 DUF3616 domain-containing protein [Verrucomicrobiota bacterium]
MLLLGATLHAADSATADAGEYRGLCDASAAIAVPGGSMLVASDEDNVLRLYDPRNPGPPIASYDLGPGLELTGRSPETDIEACATVGDRVFWITSHGRNAKGKERPNRGRLFATRTSTVGGRVVVEVDGSPYVTLLADLIGSPALSRFRLDRAAEKRPKDKGGLNIEGLAATATGGLLIGFRNPIPQKQALVVPLLNPSELPSGGSARLGEPLLLDLGGLGIRDLVWIGHHYLILAGSAQGGGSHRLYSWAGPGADAQFMSVVMPPESTPEALVALPGADGDRLMLLSDDGTRLIGDCECKKLKNPLERRFRAWWLVIGS